MTTVIIFAIYLAIFYLWIRDEMYFVRVGFDTKNLTPMTAPKISVLVDGSVSKFLLLPAVELDRLITGRGYIFENSEINSDEPGNLHNYTPGLGEK